VTLNSSLVTLELLAEARRLVAAGISVVPVKTDGTKMVDTNGPWRQFQERLPHDGELRLWFDKTLRGIAVVNGGVSGNLETLDFDEPGLYEQWGRLMEDEGYGGILLAGRLPVVQTPSGGVKVFWRSSVAAPRTVYLAWLPGKDDPKKKTIRIETQGEGKSSLVAPSPAACHPAGVPYVYLQGHLADVPTITAEDRDAILSLARTFNLWTPPPAPGPAPRPSVAPALGELRPGDDFNARGEWEPLLRGFGLERRYGRGNASFYGWADKPRSTAVSVNVGGTNHLYVHSTNASPLEPGESYTLFGAYAFIQHGGDFRAATKALAAGGYGTPSTPNAGARVSRKREPKPSEEPSPMDEDGPAGKDGPAGEDKEEEGAGDFLPGTTVPGTTVPSGEAFNFTDLGNAKRLAHLFKTDIRYCHAWQQWLLWNGRYWHPDASGGIYRLVHRVIASIREDADREPLEERRVMLRQWAVKCESLSRMEAMVKTAQSLPGLPIDVPQLDQEAMKLTVQNGTVDLRTGTLLTHSREDFSTKLCSVRYDQNAAAPVWDKFLRRVLAGDKERVDFMQRAVGYALTGDSRRRVLVILYGNKGRNGKSTFLGTITKMMGDYGMTTPSDTLMVKRGENVPTNDIARLRSARFVAASESDEGNRLSEGLVKKMTGSDMMTARFLHQEFFDFKPEFKLFFGTQHRPIIRGTDEGMWDRLRMVPFDERIPDEEIDGELEKKLLLELPGILAWAMRGCLAWQESGLGMPGAVADAIADYRREMDTVGQFLEDRCVISKELKSPASVIYNAYKVWCLDNGEKHVDTQTAFGLKLSKRDILPEKLGGIGYRIGIGLLAQGYVPP